MLSKFYFELFFCELKIVQHSLVDFPPPALILFLDSL